MAYIQASYQMTDGETSFTGMIYDDDDRLVSKTHSPEEFSSDLDAYFDLVREEERKRMIPDGADEGAPDSEDCGAGDDCDGCDGCCGDGHCGDCSRCDCEPEADSDILRELCGGHDCDKCTGTCGLCRNCCGNSTFRDTLRSLAGMVMPRAVLQTGLTLVFGAILRHALRSLGR